MTNNKGMTGDPVVWRCTSFCQIITPFRPWGGVSTATAGHHIAPPLPAGPSPFTGVKRIIVFLPVRAQKHALRRGKGGDFIGLNLHVLARCCASGIMERLEKKMI